MTKKKTAPKQAAIITTGKQLEELFSIPQQYRSRYDKQYASFISPASSAPRTYTEQDVLAYQLICKHKGQSRLLISQELAKLAKENIIAFYPSKMFKSIDDVLSYNPVASRTTDANNKVAQRQVVKSLQSNYQLADEVGQMKERVRVMTEEQTDINLFLDELADAIARLVQQLKSKDELIDTMLMRIATLERQQ